MIFQIVFRFGVLICIKNKVIGTLSGHYGENAA